ncbi:MAG: CheR family methyltransferase [Polyangiales bacterium]
MLSETSDIDIEIALLLDAIYKRYHYDFRDYSQASLRRRLGQALKKLGLRTLSEIQSEILRNARAFSTLLDFLTVPVSDLFRDPAHFRAVRERVVPVLRTYPSLKLWVAGCSTGEEAYSLAIVLREEGLLERSLIYATDISPRSVRTAKAGVYSEDRLQKFDEAYQRAGGNGALADHYTAGYNAVTFDRSLRSRIVFSDHSLATDSVFAEVQYVSCRNVLIYFNRELQDRAIALFRDSLCRRGFLALGAKETLRHSSHAAAFAEFAREERIYQRY